MNIVVLTDSEGGTAALTTDAPAPHYGPPVLRVVSRDLNGDFGPGDLLLPRLTAGQFVRGWARQPGRSDEEIDAARRFLSCVPELVLDAQ